MTTTKGAAQTSLANASTATVSATNYYVARWVSPKLNQTSVSANTWTYDFACKSSNASANFPVSSTNKAVYVNAYVWRTSTQAVVGTIKDGTTNATYSEPSAGTEKSEHGTFVGSAVANCVANDDVIIIEMWFQVTQASATSYTQTIYFDGTTENRSTGTTVSNYAAFVETPENLIFVQSYSIAIASTHTLSASLDKIRTSINTISSSFSVADSIKSKYSYQRGLSESIMHDGDVEKGKKRYFYRSIGGIKLI